MALLPLSPFTLTGGCLCSAIRYNIEIPPLEARPLIPNALPTPINDQGDTVPTRMPLIGLDHCSDCRRACGGLVQCWFICQLQWVEFKLQERGSDYVKTYTCAEVANPSPATVQETYLGHFESSKNTQRCFCGRCGTGVTYHYSEDRGASWTLGPIVDIAVGTLDDESIKMVKPERHLWWEHGTEWVKTMMDGGDLAWMIRHPSGRPSQVVNSIGA